MFRERAVNGGGVFISHSHADKDIVTELIHRFEKDSINYWLDDKELLVGQVIDKAVSAGIQENWLFLILLTPTSVRSAWVERELDEAFGSRQSAARTRTCRVFRASLRSLCPALSCCQLVEQGLCLFQIERVEAVGEPAIDGREEIAGFGALALVAPETGEAGARLQLEGLRLLTSGDRERLHERAFRRRGVGRLVTDQEFAAHSI
jgi:hypothetical protein